MTVEPGRENPFQSPITTDEASEEPSTVKEQTPWSPPRAVFLALALFSGGILVQSVLTMQTGALMVNHRASVAMLVMAMAVLVRRRTAWIYMLCYLSLLIVIPVVMSALMVFHFVVPDPSSADLPQLGDILLCLLLPTVCYVAAFACLLGRNARAFYFRSKV